jgi:hypothetical protein
MQWRFRPDDPRGRLRVRQPTTTTPAPPAGDGRRPEPVQPATTADPLFPPRDADAETHRRWLAHSPWPEVVFASA